MTTLRRLFVILLEPNMALTNFYRQCVGRCVQINAYRSMTLLGLRNLSDAKTVVTLNTNWHHEQLRTISGMNVGHESVQCWKCGSVVNQDRVIFCKSCKTVQRPHKKSDFFEILGQERTFELDPKELTNRFRLLQMQLHPDRFSNHTEVIYLSYVCPVSNGIFSICVKEEKEVSAIYSSLVNQAYKTLGSPLDRALYLLELNGYSLDESEIHFGTEFFAEIMEINEELAEIEDSEELGKFSEQNQTKITDLFR